MRIASICAVVAFSPRRTRTGSVGMTLEIRKTMMTSPASVGTNQASRERIISRRRMERPRALFRTASRRLAVRKTMNGLLVVSPAHVLPAADRAEADSADIGGIGAVPLGVVDEDAHRLLGHLCRRLLVQYAPLLLVVGRERLVDPLVELGILDVRGVTRSDVARAVELADPVVGIDVVGALPQRHHVVVLFAILHPALDDRPGRRFDLDVDADLLGAVLQQRGRLL